MLRKTDAWSDIRRAVENIANTENSYYVSAKRDVAGRTYRIDELMNDGSSLPTMPEMSEFSENGFSQLASRLEFPAKFMRELVLDGHDDLAETIIQTKSDDFFGRDKTKDLFFREFNGKIHGVLSDRYSVFDDKEILPILESSEYLMGATEFWYDISPDYFHTRFVSPNKLHIGNDPSPFSLCVFVDNSMVGRSMFRIRFGLYRWACTNGVIFGLKEFVLIKERHIGEKDWMKVVAEATLDAKKYEDMLIQMAEKMQEDASAIYNMTDEQAVTYIKTRLTTTAKKAEEIIEVYNTVYGGFSKWDLCNAITEVAHNVGNVENRILFEERALKVA